MKKSILLFILFTLSLGATAQEAIYELRGNPVLIQKHKERQLLNISARSAAAPGDTLSLPFLDDFSKDDVYPDNTKWLDSNVFINPTFPKTPPTIGVATFDGLASHGKPYNWNAPGGSSGKADSLTSKPIDMSGVIVSDSVFFSFFYQAQGRGNAPETADSLILEFKESNDTVWTKVWSKAGYSLPSSDSTFNFVNLYVPSQYWYNGFQFKFRNKATLSGNVDHWHIDYVYMAKFRKINENGSFKDVAFAYRAPSLLRNYQAMPYRQFRKTELKDNLSVFLRNNDDDATPENTSYSYTIYNRTASTTQYTYNATAENYPSYASSGYQSDPSHAFPVLPDTIPEPLTDSTLFEVVHSIGQLGADINHDNDTSRFQQKFYNYYAYDDGSAELAYGISTSFALLAYKFTLNTPDTLRAVSIYWNPVVDSTEGHGFRLTVWGDAGGQPGAILYQDSVKYPVYHFGYNDFHYYMIDDTILPLSGTFYIGWLQIDPETLNVGLDMNNNAQNKIFYNTAGSWNNTVYKGALMMRPHFGEVFTNPALSIPEPVTNPSSNSYTIFPNPANDRLYIRRNSNEQASATIFDAYGRMVLPKQQLTGEAVDVSMLATGMYLVRIEDAAGNNSAYRVIISK